MKHSGEPDWWRVVVLSGQGRILDPAAWRERWKGKEYKTSPKLSRILMQLQKAGFDSTYVEWLLRPDYLKGRHGYPASRLPEEAREQVVDLIRELDALLKKMREMVDRQKLPGRPVEIFRRWFLSFEKDVEHACPLIAGFSAILKKFREKKPGFFRGHPSDERVLVAFLVSEELRRVFPRRYWPVVAALIEIRFPSDKIWSTPYKLSRAVGRLKSRIGAKAAVKTVEAYRQWYKYISSKPVSVNAR